MSNDTAIIKARALYYNLFATFFIVPSDTKDYLALVSLINLLKDNPIDQASKDALEQISNKLDPTSNIALMQEFDDLFYNPATAKIRLTASFYDEGLESGKKRVEMLQFLAKTKIRRDEQNFYEYEDSIGFIFAFLAQLCDLVANGDENYVNTIHCIFDQVLNDFVEDVAKEIYEHSAADIYKNLMIVLHSFIELERLYLEVSKPAPKEKEMKKESCEVISDEEKARRARNKALKANGPKNQVDESCPVHVAYDVEDGI